MSIVEDPTPMRFRTVLHRSDNVGSTAFFEVPPEAMAALSARKRPAVRATVNGHGWRSTVSVYGGKFYVPTNAEVRAGAGIAPGDMVEVTLELDRDARVVELPPDLGRALAGAGLTETFRSLSYTRQRELALAVETAKRPETRVARLDKALAAAAERARR